MKLLSVALARSLWIGHTRELNPNGRYLYPMVLPLLLDLFKFKKYPQLNDSLDESKGLIFEGCGFKNDKDVLIGIKLSLFDYGIIAESGSSTKDTDAFLEALLSEVQNTFKLPHYKDVLETKQYLSQLYISTDKSLNMINPKLMKISEYLSEHVSGFGEVDYQLGGFSFWPDQIKPINPLPFSIERVTSEPFSKNRYLSTSSLQTEQHLDLLEKLEKLLG